MSDVAVSDAVAQAMAAISQWGDDTRAFTKRESLDFYASVIEECRVRADALEEELGDDD